MTGVGAAGGHACISASASSRLWRKGPQRLRLHGGALDNLLKFFFVQRVVARGNRFSFLRADAIVALQHCHKSGARVGWGRGWGRGGGGGSVLGKDGLGQHFSFRPVAFGFADAGQVAVTITHDLIGAIFRGALRHAFPNLAVNVILAGGFNDTDRGRFRCRRRCRLSGGRRLALHHRGHAGGLAEHVVVDAQGQIERGQLARLGRADQAADPSDERIPSGTVAFDLDRVEEGLERGAREGFGQELSHARTLTAGVARMRAVESHPA